MQTVRLHIVVLGWLAGLFCGGSLAGQAAYTLRLLPLDVDSATLARSIDWPRPAGYPDTSAVRGALQTVLTDLRDRGYYEASVDSLPWNNGQAVALQR